MAVRGKKCQDIKQVSWISSSFVNSFGSTQDSDDHSPAEKRMKIESDRKSNCINSISSVDNFVQSDLSLTRGRVWTDKYAPKNLDDIVVHKKKVSEVCDYLKSVFSLSNRNRILLITGPTGCGKTCTLTTICRFLNINIVEWTTPIDNSFNFNYDFSPFDNSFKSNKHIELGKQSSVQMFNEFILQAVKYSSLLSSDFQSINRKIVLIKDIPNVFLEYPESFHEIIKKYIIDHNALVNNNISPLAFIVSDENIARNLFPDDLKSELNVVNISFNPITSGNIIKALDRILSLEINRSSLKLKRPSKDELIDIANSSDGDLRSAILKLQFNVSCCDIKTNSVFKVPKTLDSKSERIKVIKSGSKLKNHKLMICEIDKDKAVDFFNSVGRVLYPKKEYRNYDNVNSGDYRFIHSPSVICDMYLMEPNKFINILHENYLERFTNIKDVCSAANSLSLSDLLLSSNWESKDIMITYSLNTVAHSLMVSNTKPAPNTFRPMSKSKIWTTEIKKKENLALVRRIFPDIQCEKDVLLDVIPYLNKLKLNIKLTNDENQIISKIAKYNQ